MEHEIIEIVHSLAQEGRDLTQAKVFLEILRNQGQSVQHRSSLLSSVESFVGLPSDRTTSKEFVEFDWASTLGWKIFGPNFRRWSLHRDKGLTFAQITVWSFYLILIYIFSVMSILGLVGLLDAYWCIPGAAVTLLNTIIDGLNYDIKLFRELLYRSNTFLLLGLQVFTCVMCALSMGGSAPRIYLWTVFPLVIAVAIFWEAQPPKVAIQNRTQGFAGSAILFPIITIIFGMGWIPSQSDVVWLNFGNLWGLTSRAVSFSSIQAGTSGLVAVSVLSIRMFLIGLLHSMSIKERTYYIDFSSPLKGKEIERNESGELV